MKEGWTLIRKLIAAAALCLVVYLAAAAVFRKPVEVRVAEDRPDYSVAAEYVFVTGSGTKFHRDICGSLSDTSALREFTAEGALAAGYEPCQHCMPCGLPETPRHGEI